MPVDGVINDVFIKSGDDIKPGQLLFTINMEKDENEISYLRKSIDKNTNMMDALKAITNISDSNIIEKALFFNEERKYVIEYRISYDRLIKLKNDLEINKINQEKLLREIQKKKIDVSSQLRVINENERVLDNTKKLLFKGYATNNEVETLRHKLKLSQDDLEIFNCDVQELKLLAEIALSKRRAIVNDFNNAISSELYNITQQQHELKIREEYLKERIKYKSIYSIYNGVVEDVELGLKEGFVAAGSKLIYMSPLHENLILEGVIKVRDSGFISEADSVVIKLDSYPYTRYGTLKGRIVKLLKSSSLDAANESTYKILIKPDSNYLTIEGKDYYLKSGFTSAFDIINGERTIASYFLEPIAKNLIESMRER